MIRVLVVEDSPTVRMLLVQMLQSEPGLRVVGEAADGFTAVELAESLAPDLITMDVQMPGQNGLEATRQIMNVAPTPIIVISTAYNQDAVALSLDATRAGALMVLPKPDAPDSPHFDEQRTQLVRMARAMAQVKVVRRWEPRVAPPRAAPPHPSRGGSVRLVAIACSTGGPAALRQILHTLPANFPVPIAVVQHIARGFTTGLTGWLDGARDGPRVKVAEHGEALQPGRVYLAPDDRHLGFGRDGHAQLSDAAPVGGFRPSATHLFESAAAVYGARAVGVILTGMGSDGVAGLVDLRAAGGRVIAQDEASSVVYGMAAEAVKAGAVSETLPLDAIAPRLVELAR